MNIIINEQDRNLIRSSIRTIHDWPDKGVLFRDITTLLQNSVAFRKVIEIFVDRYKNLNLSAIAGLDARGFIFGPVIAYELGLSFVPIRKKGKLPYSTISETYSLEYNSASAVEIHTDAITPGDKVVIIDDLIATGGTMLAACKLIERIGGKIVECAVVNDLSYLHGTKLLKQHGFEVFSIVEYLANDKD